jgi:hypothetical protein
MRWFELCYNPAGVTTFYHDPPSLDDVVLRELNIMDGAPSLHFWFELSKTPDRNGAPWDSSIDVATIVLALSPVRDLHFQGWGHGNRGSFRMERLKAGSLEFQFESSWFNCQGKCEQAEIEDFRVIRARSSPNKSLHPTAATSSVMESQSGGG